MSSSALRPGAWFRIFYRWTPLSAPQFINIAWILLRQYALFFVFGLVATVIAGAFLTYTIGLNAATLIIPLYVIGYAVCAEESARWMYAYQPFFSRSRATTFAIALIVFEGTLRLFLNSKYIAAPLKCLSNDSICRRAISYPGGGTNHQFTHRDRLGRILWH